MQKEVVSKEVMQELINKLEEIVNNYCWNLEPFSDENINSFFDGTEEEVTYYKSLIVDSIESTSFLWSSKKIAEEIAKSIIESSKYTNNLIKNMSSIKLKYVTSLPTSDISENTIYILKASDGTSKDTLNLYNATDGWITIGDFSISLDDYYNKTEIDSKLDDKANKTEVISNDKIMQTLDSTTNSADTILSTNGLQVELDKKVDKGNIVTTIDSTSTNNEVVGAKAFYDFNINNMLNINAHAGFNIDTYEQPFIAHVNPIYNGVLGTFPNEIEWGSIIQLPAQGYRAQMLITEQGMYYRIMHSGKWLPWYKVNATQVSNTTTFPKETT